MLTEGPSSAGVGGATVGGCDGPASWGATATGGLVGAKAGPLTGALVGPLFAGLVAGLVAASSAGVAPGDAQAPVNKGVIARVDVSSVDRTKGRSHASQSLGLVEGFGGNIRGKLAQVCGVYASSIGWGHAHGLTSRMQIADDTTAAPRVTDQLSG
jgi:hypothetical protein